MQSDIKLNQPSSSDELVATIVTIVNDQFSRNGARPVDGSLLASLLRQKYPALDYRELGLSKLSDAIRLGVEKEQLRRITAAKHMEVVPFASAAVLSNSVNPPERFGPPLYVQPELWKAVVLSLPGTHSFMRRGTGELIHAQQKDLGSMRAKSDLVEVETVSESMQLQWLKEYLNSVGQVETGETALDDLLRGGIKALGRSVDQGWKIYRSKKVVGHVKRWSETHGIPDGLVLGPRRATSKVLVSNDLPTPSSVDDKGFRLAVVAAVQDMSIDELDELRLPIRLVRRHFRPR